jgi:RecA-family ATPase
MEIDGAVLLNAHPSQAGLNSGSGTAGSTAWNNAVRSRLYLQRLEGEDAEPDARVLETKKSNYGRIGGTIALRWSRGVFVPDLPGVSAELSQEDDFLHYLDKAFERGFWPSASKNSSQYAPKTLRLVGCKRPSKEIEHTMIRLVDEGVISAQVVRDNERHLRTVLKRRDDAGA